MFESSHQHVDRRSSFPFPYLPIERHAVIGDGRTAAMVGADGSIDWWCLPNFDGEIVLGALLDAERGGAWRIGPAEAMLGDQHYIQDSAAIRTDWHGPGWLLELLDTMPWQNEGDADDGEMPRRGRVILRRLRCVIGQVDCEVSFAPRKSFADDLPWRTVAGWRHGQPPGRWLGLWCSHPRVTAKLQGHGRAVFPLREGDTVWFAAGQNEDPAHWNTGRAERTLAHTIHAWQRWVQQHPYFGPFKDALLRSAQTIRLLHFQPSGAQVAAPTCSLPEQIGGSRNFDYRFAWVRDSALAAAVFSQLGDLRAAQQYMDWLARLDASTGMPLQVLYAIDGESDTAEHDFPQLDGYRGSRPVRIGNQGGARLQIDALAYLADGALTYLEQGGAWRPAYWELIRHSADFAAANWQNPDHGMWELQPPRHHVASKAMSWVVLNRACRIAERLGQADALASWRQTMEAIHADVMARGWSETLQSFRQHYDSDELDASALLLATMDFLPADHPRMQSTIAAIQAHLTRDGLVWRFHPKSIGHPEMALDGLEGAFLPCTFWLASALARAGWRGEAREILERVDAMFGQLGILPEQADPRTGAALGNMPLLFSHAEHIKAVLDYARTSRIGALGLAAGTLARKVWGMLPQ